MSWLPAMMFMHMLDDDEPYQFKQVNESDDTHQQSPTGYNAGYTPGVTEICPPVTDDTPAAANSINNTRCTPTVAPRAWHHTAMSAATFTLSALLAYVTTEAICKRIRGRN